MSCRVKKSSGKKQLTRSQADIDMMEKFSVINQLEFGHGNYGRTQTDKDLQMKWCPYRGWIPVDAPKLDFDIETPKSVEKYNRRNDPYGFNIVTPKSEEKFKPKNHLEKFSELKANYAKNMNDIMRPLARQTQENFRRNMNTLRNPRPLRNNVSPTAPTGPPTVFPVAPTGPPTVFPVAPTGPPTVFPVAPTGPPTVFPVAPTGPPTVFPVAPTGPPTVFPVGPTAPTGPPTVFPVGPTAPTGPPTVFPVGPTAPTGPPTVFPVGPTAPTGPPTFPPVDPTVISGPPVVIKRTDSDWDERTVFDERLQVKWCPYRGWIPVNAPKLDFDIETPHSVENYKNYAVRSYPKNYPTPNAQQKKPASSKVEKMPPGFPFKGKAVKNSKEDFLVYQQSQSIPPVNSYIGPRTSFDIALQKKWAVNDPYPRVVPKEGFKDYLMSFGDPDNSWSYSTQSFKQNTMDF